jgi:ferredoxin-NADP reductase/ferredoxin
MERGAEPEVSKLLRRGLRAISAWTSPLLPDDYLELINPLWSTRELRGRVERVEPETPRAATVVIRPGWEWPGHRPGQYVRLGVEVDGVHHWRAYSLTSDPGRPDGRIAITPKLVDGGRVSPFLLRRARAGPVLRLGGVEGTVVLDEPPAAALLFISAGRGITPIVSMLRSLARERRLRDVVHVHSERTAADVVFRRELHGLAALHPGYRLHERITAERGRLAPAELDGVCPDWREREAYACGPPGLLDALRERWQREGEIERLHSEHFQPDTRLGEGEHGEGGRIRLCASGIDAHSDGTLPILVAGEAAGATLPHGCRMGICHSCVGRLRAGRVRDLRTGQVQGQAGEMVRTCVNAPEGDVEIDL